MFVDCHVITLITRGRHHFVRRCYCASRMKFIDTLRTREGGRLTKPPYTLLSYLGAATAEASSYTTMTFRHALKSRRVLPARLLIRPERLVSQTLPDLLLLLGNHRGNEESIDDPPDAQRS